MPAAEKSSGVLPYAVPLAKLGPNERTICAIDVSRFFHRRARRYVVTSERVIREVIGRPAATRCVDLACVRSVDLVTVKNRYADVVVSPAIDDDGDEAPVTFDRLRNADFATAVIAAVLALESSHRAGRVNMSTTAPAAPVFDLGRTTDRAVRPLPGERLLWTGRPRAFAPSDGRWAIGWLRRFGFLGVSLLVFAARSADWHHVLGTPRVSDAFLIGAGVWLFVCLQSLLVALPQATLERRRTTYVLTTHRTVVQIRSRRAYRQKSSFFDLDFTAECVERPDGSGNVVIGRVTFEHIGGVRAVYDLATEALHAHAHRPLWWHAKLISLIAVKRNARVPTVTFKRGSYTPPGDVADGERVCKFSAA